MWVSIVLTVTAVASVLALGFAIDGDRIARKALALAEENERWDQDNLWRNQNGR